MLLLLLLASWLAATLSGAAGFGGALVLLPVFSATIGVKAAVPVLTIAQIAGNASRVWFGRREIRWRPTTYFLAGAIPASLAGSTLFVSLPARPVLVALGVLLIGVVLLRRLGITRFDFGERGLLVGGIPGREHQNPLKTQGNSQRRVSRTYWLDGKDGRSAAG